MANIESLVIRMEADLRGLKSEMVSGQAKVQKSVGDMNKSIQDFSKKSNSGFSFVKQAAASMAGFIGGAVVTAAFRKAAQAASAFAKAVITDGVKAAQVQEDAINKLNQALAQSGQFSEAASQSQQKFAASIQQSTKFGDEQIIETQALIQSLGQLDEDGLKGATQAAVDLSAALGVDLKAAALLVGKAAAGEVSSFSRYGLVIAKGADNSETFANALDAINSKFGGAAASQVNTYSGATQQLSNTFGDATEEIGFLITQNPAVLTAVKESEKFFKFLGEEIKANDGSLKKLVTSMLIFAIDVIPASIRGVSEFIGLLEDVDLGILGVARAIAVIKGESDQFIQALNDQVNEAEAAKEARIAQFEKIAQAAEDLRDRIAETAEDTAGSQSQVTAALEAQSLAAGAAKEAMASLSESERERLEEQIALGEELLDAKEVETETAIDLLQRKFDAEQSLLEEAKNKNLLTEEQFQAKLKKANDKFEKDKTKLSEVESKKRQEIAEQTFGALSGILGNTAKAAKAFGKEGFEAYKAFATAQALIDTFASAQAAYKSVVGIPFVGPTLAPIAAAAAVGAGLANVAQIQSQTPGFAHGGRIPGIGFQDSVNIRATPGEEVIDRSLSKQLRSRLGGQNQQGGASEMKFTFDFRGGLGEFVELIETQLIERNRLNVSEGAFL